MTERPEPDVEPPATLTDPLELLSAYVDWYRAVVIKKVEGLSDTELRTSRVPSGWTPIQLVNHLAFMERRWLQWGWGGVDVADPWGDNVRGEDPWEDAQPGAPWYVSPETSLDEVVGRLREAGDESRRLIAGADLRQRAPDGPRFADRETIPVLGWILVHVLQEYSRHAGHLDIVRELIDGDTGE